MRRRFNLWMITILMASVIVISATTPHYPAVTRKQHISNRQEKASVETYSNSKLNIFNRLSRISSTRFRRNPNDDAFSTLHSRISSLARIVSGVTLYNGLVDGSIPVDEAISELMNIGSFSLDDLMNFDKPKVDGFAEQLKTVSTGITDQGKESEVIIMDLVKMKKMWNEVGDLKSLPDNSKFGEIQLMKDFDLSVIGTFKLNDAIRKLSFRIASDVSNIKSDLEKVAEASKKAVEVMEKKNILETLAKMTPFHKYANLVRYTEQWQAFLKLKAIKADEVKADVKVLQGIGKDATSAFRIMRGISLSQSVNHIDRKHTPGFVNGYADLKHLPKDSEDSWLRENFTWLELKDGLTTISNLEERMKTLSEKWTELGKEPIRKAVQQAEFFEANLKGISDTLNVVDNLVSEVNKYPLPIPQAAYVHFLVETSQTMLELFEKGKSIREISILLEQNNKVISEIDVSNATSIMSALHILEKMESHIELLQNGKKIKELSQVLIDRPTDYTGIMTDSSSKSCQDFFNALKNQKGDNLEKVAIAAGLAMQLREIKNNNDFSISIGIASSAVSGSLASYESVRTAMGDIKKSSAESNQTFSQLKDFQKFLKPLGDSSAVINKIQKVLEKEKQLMDFVANGDIVKQLAESKTITRVNTELIEEHWVHFEATSRECRKLLNDVKRKRAGVTKPGDENLESYGPIIERLDGLGDIDLDLDNRIMVVDGLSASYTDPIIKPQLDALRNTLKELSTLDLTFTRQSSSLKGMSLVLAGINDVFMSTTPMTTVKPTGKNECPFDSRHNDDDGDILMTADEYYKDEYRKDKSENKSESNVNLYVFWGIIGLVLLIGVVSFVRCYIKAYLNSENYMRRKREKEEKNKKLKGTGKTKKSKSKSTETVTSPPGPPGEVQLDASAPAPVRAPVAAPAPSAPVPAAVFPVVSAAPAGSAPVPRPGVAAAAAPAIRRQ